MFYEENGQLVCGGFVVWDETMPPAAITVLGNVNNGFGFLEESDMNMFVLDSSTGLNYVVSNTWNTSTSPFVFNDGASGYTNNGLYQILSMNLSEYVGGDAFSSTEDLSALGAGTYSLVVADENGCSVSIEVEITETDELMLEVNDVVAGPHILGDIELGFGSVDIALTGGTSVYTYVWNAVLDDGSEFNASSEDLSSLFAGTYSVTVTDENGCSVSLDITVPFYGPSDWSVDESGAMHEIEVPSDANITIDYDAITYGDYLAVADASGNIGGVMMWNGSFDLLVAYGSAFSTGEIFNWMLWDASTDTYYSADAVYDEAYPDTDEFSAGGLSHVLDIIARTVYVQEIDMSTGWGLYSTFISPTDGALETVLGDVVDNLIIMKDENGSVYWPLLGMNFIGSLTDGEGYQIKMGSGDLLEVSGDLIPSDFEMFMPSGWSYIAYLHQESADAEVMMSPISESLIILKDGSGSVYWPFIGVNAIGGGSGLMSPGQGYQIKVYENSLFSYPDIDGASRFSSNATPIYPLTKFSESVNTGSNMTIGIPLEAWSSEPEIGDEIAAYNATGRLVGSVTFNGESTALTVWGDDITTDAVEGLLEGEEISFEVWRKSENKIEELKIENWVEGNNVYGDNGIAIAGMITSSATAMGHELYPNVPNPFNSMTSIDFFTPESGKVMIGVYDMLGNLVSELTNENYEAGMYRLEFRSEDVAPGTYFIRMTAAGYSTTNTMNIIK
jgi:hypothetical protein